MKNISYFAMLALLLIFVGCDNEDTPPKETNPISCNQYQDLCELNGATFATGLSLLKRLNEDQPTENIIISPVSINTALAMTTNGAQESTFDEMMQTMHIGGWSMEKMNTAHQDFLTNVPNLDNDVTLSLANSIWHRAGYPVKQDFIDRNTTFFNSEVNAIDFANSNAKDQINGWVSDNTKGLIPTIIDQVPDNIVMYLINATYFKGNWRVPFNEKLTFNTDFYLENGQVEQVEMMSHGEITLPYYVNEDFQAVDLAYGDSIFSMTVILPNEGIAMNTFIDNFSSSEWLKQDLALSNRELFLSIPKFKLEYKAKLNQPLADLGMPSAFTPGLANLKGIADADLYIDEAMHKTFIEVNEKGTEGAAVTSIGIVETSLPQIPFVVLNRPFLFLIRENNTGSVLFIGKVMNPKEG